MSIQAHKVGEEIKTARKSMALSMRSAAKRAGVSDSRWRQVESGVQWRSDGVQIPASASAETLAKMAIAVELDPVGLLDIAGFDASTAEAVTRTPPQTKTNVIDLDDFPEQEAELIRTFVSGLQLGLRGRKT